jgi:hypothetical protein
VLANNAVLITSSAALGWDALARGLGFMCKSSPQSGIEHFQGRTMIYYGDIGIQDSDIYEGADHRLNRYGKCIMPDSSTALERLLVLWMRIDRPVAVANL